jgi:hypothetical protein
VPGRDGAQLVAAEHLLQASGLVARQAGGDPPEHVEDPEEVVVPGRVLVIGGHGLAAGPDGRVDLGATSP